MSRMWWCVSLGALRSGRERDKLIGRPPIVLHTAQRFFSHLMSGGEGSGSVSSRPSAEKNLERCRAVIRRMVEFGMLKGAFHKSIIADGLKFCLTTVAGEIEKVSRRHVETGEKQRLFLTTLLEEDATPIDDWRLTCDEEFQLVPYPFDWDAERMSLGLTPDEEKVFYPLYYHCFSLARGGRDDKSDFRRKDKKKPKRKSNSKTHTV